DCRRPQDHEMRRLQSFDFLFACQLASAIVGDGLCRVVLTLWTMRKAWSSRREAGHMDELPDPGCRIDRRDQVAGAVLVHLVKFSRPDGLYATGTVDDMSNPLHCVAQALGLEDRTFPKFDLRQQGIQKPTGTGWP